jgi:hypothetical protein
MAFPSVAFSVAGALVSTLTFEREGERSFVGFGVGGECGFVGELDCMVGKGKELLGLDGLVRFWVGVLWYTC